MLKTMKDQFSGKVELKRLFEPQTAQGVFESLHFRGASTALSKDLACTVLGSPRFDDEDAATVARQSGLAAGLSVAWKKRGDSVASCLSGTYAIAIVDAGAGSVFLAVDRFSVETLCYAIDGDTLTFSNRADCVEGRGKELDPQAIFDYLHFHMIPAPRTIFSKVRRLPAAHGLLIDRHGVHEKRHWPLRFVEDHRPPFDLAKGELLSLIKASVGEALEGQAKVGAFLSGGTDSSTIAGMLGLVSGAPAPTYSIGFEAEGYDEMEYARLAARHFGCESHEYYVTPADVLTSIRSVARHHDQPFGNASALPAYFCAQMAKADGCSKIIAGDGGDELFGGNSRYAMQKFLQLYHGVPAGLRRLVEPMCGDDSPLRRIPGLRQATGYVRHSRVPMPHRLENFNLLMQLDPASMLSDEFLDLVDMGMPAQHMQGIWDECQTDSFVNRMLAYDWRYTLADSDLPKVRGAAAMAGIGVGYPLLANRIVDFSMGLPPDWKVRRYKLRWFFKEALRGFLPDRIIAKKKQGFGLPFGVWTSRDPALKQLAQASLDSLAERGVIRQDFAQKLVSTLLPQHPGYYGVMVWVLIMLEQWLQDAVPDYRIGTAG